MKQANYSNNKLRLIWVGISSIQIGLITLLLLLSVRSVWPLINKSVNEVIGLEEHSFSAIFAFLIFLLSISISIFFFQFRTKKKSSRRLFYVVLILFQILLNSVLLFQLFPNLVSMYLSQLPFWLLKKGALIIFPIISILSILLFIRKWADRKDMVLNSLIGVNGVLLLIVLSFAFISITVRGPDFSKNSFNNLLKTSEGYFTINTKTEGLHSEAISLHPEISIPLDMNFGGDYLSAGDLTGDGIVEIVSAKYWVEPLDKNRIKSIVVQSLLTDSLTGEKGKVLWSWESQYPAPKKIGSGRGSSAAIAVFDLQTGEANKKLLFATDGWLYEITFGENGFVSEKKVPTGSINSADCLIIANLDGTGKHYLLLKDAYHNIWAFDMNLNLLWKTKNPGGYLLAHRIAACDINRDGTDEILAGATMLNNKGEVIRTLKTNSVELWYGGHIDGIVPIIQNNELSIAVTYCDGLGFALFDSEGKLKWEVTDEHFEYLVGGYFFNTPELNKQFQLISKVHYDAKNPQVMMNQDGKLLGIFKPSSTVFSADWTGDGYHEMIFLSPASVYQGTKKIADLFVPGTEYNNAHILRVADVWGTISLKPDGIPDVILKSIDEDNTHFLHIYPNLKGKKPVNYVYPGIGWESSANYFTKYYEYKR